MSSWNPYTLKSNDRLRKPFILGDAKFKVPLFWTIWRPPLKISPKLIHLRVKDAAENYDQFKFVASIYVLQINFLGGS